MGRFQQKGLAMKQDRGHNPITWKLRFVRFMVYLAFLPFIKKISGIRNLPKESPFILAGNHMSHIDGFLLGTFGTRYLNRNMHFLATTKYYHHPVFHFLAEITQSIWTDWREPARALLIALDYLKRGEVVGIFPEGIMYTDGKLKKGKSGVAALALLAKVPVVPAGLIDTDKVLPSGKVFPRPARCKVNIGAPVEFKDFYREYDEAKEQNDHEKIKEIEERVMNIVMREIARLSNQEYNY